MTIIVASFPNAYLIIVGDGYLRDQLELCVIDLGISQNVFFTSFRLDTPALLKLFDLFVLSSISEGLPMVF